MGFCLSCPWICEPIARLICPLNQITTLIRNDKTTYLSNCIAHCSIWLWNVRLWFSNMGYWLTVSFQDTYLHIEYGLEALMSIATLICTPNQMTLLIWTNTSTNLPSCISHWFIRLRNVRLIISSLWFCNELGWVSSTPFDFIYNFWCSLLSTSSILE